MAQSPLASLVAQRLARFPNLDPRAVLAVASQEGLGGGIGDNGTSFGPWQLHQGGAYPSFAPQNPSQAQAWATSPQGIDYALSRIAGVAGGLKGARAVNAIVTQFERPADPGHEIAGALRSYGIANPAQGNYAQPAPPAPAYGLVPSPAAQYGRSLASELVAAGQALLNGGSPNLPRLFALAKSFQQSRR